MAANLHPLIAVVGPTASGKTALALALAERFAAEIVNYDSVQIYRGFDIGSAKLPREERRGIPHHLLDVIDPANRVHRRRLLPARPRAVLDRLRRAGKIAVLTGGSGFYLSALVRGLLRGRPVTLPCASASNGARPGNPAGYLSRLLARLDPEAAARIHPNDTPKLIRAVEVSLRAGRPMSEQWLESGESSRGVQPADPRPVASPRVVVRKNRRARRRDVRAGSARRSRRLARKRHRSGCARTRFARLRPMLDCLDGKLSPAEAVEATLRQPAAMPSASDLVPPARAGNPLVRRIRRRSRSRGLGLRDGAIVLRKALIVGCGYTGSRVAPLLAAQGWSVTATCRGPRPPARARRAGVRVVRFEVGCDALPDAKDAVVLLSVPTLRNGDPTPESGRGVGPRSPARRLSLDDRRLRQYRTRRRLDAGRPGRRTPTSPRTSGTSRSERPPARAGAPPRGHLRPRPRRA